MSLKEQPMEISNVLNKNYYKMSQNCTNYHVEETKYASRTSTIVPSYFSVTCHLLTLKTTVEGFETDNGYHCYLVKISKSAFHNQSGTQDASPTSNVH